MPITPDVVTAAYVKSREEIKALKDQIEAIEVIQRKRESWLLDSLQTQGLQNMKTLHGTCYISVKESCTVGDWDTLLNWIKEGERWEYLNKAVAKTAVLEYSGPKRENGVPPGVNYSAIRTVQIRKS